ncbi:heme-binding Shp domain-containing protein [Konateibacter massiliensis]|uniref:heme-binding Shp domain-containing protein n=1 Tax=Konateibacter massiliensis TaxID=2002841 RepID=UPI000C1522B9|nr:heme-binding Shp domain-containing protein [Konateibacter massiliensis]
MRKQVLDRVLSRRQRIAAALLIAVFFGNILTIQTVHAAEAGTAYMASATAYYAHPVTGEIEDPGNNEAIGQGMTESVTNSTALIEQINSGGMYATIRLSMMDNISNVRFWTQEWGGSGWTSASASVMQENAGGDYTSDFRIEIPNENAVVKVQFYVTPMGRDIIYFIAFSNFAEGSGDFIVSVDSSAGTANTETEETQTEDSSNDTGTQTVTQAASSAKSANTQTVGSTSQSLGSTAASSALTAQSGKKTGAQLIEEAEGLVLSDESLLNKEETELSTENQEKETSQIVPAMSWVFVLQCVIILTIPGATAGLVLLLVMTVQRKRERDDL